MHQPITIGLDLAKSVFQVHAVGADGTVVYRRQLRRSQVLGFFAGLESCLVGMEACAGAHHWGRELIALGREVKLMPPAYVKPYVKRGKTDANDAEAIAEAVTRPSMRFVPVKSAEQQAALLDHKSRDFLVRQRTQVVNAIRAHLSEFGIVAAKGIHNVDRLLEVAEDVPEAARPAMQMRADQLRDLEARIAEVTARVSGSSVGEALGHDPRHRPHGLVRLRSHDAGRRSLPVCARLRSLAGPHTEGAFQRGQRAAWADIEGREPLLASPALSRGYGAHRRPQGPPYG